ncbi:MAG: AAA family ATPase [Acidiferrobacterales bacterium]
MPRHWGICGYPNAGKSTFLMALRQPLLLIDTDGRAAEIARLGADVRSISSNPRDHRDPATVLRIIQQRDTSEIGTVCLDSLTSVLTAQISLGLADNRANRLKNKASAWVGKANDMRLFQGALEQTGRDFAIIWHYEDGRDKNGDSARRHTIPEVERKKLARSLNAVIEISVVKGRRRATILWSRVGRQGIFIEDTEGYWAGVPEQIDDALYGTAGATFHDPRTAGGQQ